MEAPYFLIDRAFGEELLHVPIVDVCVNVPIYQEPHVMMALSMI